MISHASATPMPIPAISSHHAKPSFMRRPV
jgi:hypothetical protein